MTRIPRHEVVAALTLCLVPFTTFVLATVVTHAYVDKYLITTIAGVALLIAYVTDRLQAWRHRAGLFMALIFGLWAAGVMAYMARYTEPHGYRIADVNLHLIETAKEPIAVFDEHEFMKTRFYLPANLREKVYFLTDRKLAVAYSGTDTNELVFQRLEPFVNMNVVNLCAFTKQYSHFLILLVRPYSAPRPTWVIPQLLKDNAQVKLITGDLIDQAVLSVTLKGPSGC